MNIFTHTPQRLSSALLHVYTMSFNHFKIIALIVAIFLVSGIRTQAICQNPTVTIQFANPTYNITTSQYCADVEFKSDTSGTIVFGMNVRFFYDESVLDFIGFSDFQGGYGAVAPNPPTTFTSPAGPALFNFAGAATWVNGAIQLIDPNSTPIILPNNNWTKIFQVCFTIDQPNLNSQSFCPSLVWDMEQNPENGGFLLGDDGVVITAVDPDPNMESLATIENVDQFNWIYIGSGTSPWGQPQPVSCISLETPTLSLNAPANVVLEFGESTDPSNTGYAMATSTCVGEVSISYNDLVSNGSCPHDFTIERTWTANDDCNNLETSVQSIFVNDTQAPVLSDTPEDTKIICDQLPPVPVVSALDGTESVEVVYTETILPGGSQGEFDVYREWVATDDCGNASMATQYILWIPNAILSTELIIPSGISCNSNFTISSLVTGNTENITYSWEIIGQKSFIVKGQGNPKVFIHLGMTGATIKLTIKDHNGCITTTSAVLDCTGQAHPVSTGNNGIKTRSDERSMGWKVEQLNAWPVPANENMTISFNSNQELRYEISMENFIGQTYINESSVAGKGSNTNSLDVSLIPDGTYILQLKSNQGVYTMKMVVLHAN